jgi:WD40 repeat protein
MRRDVAIKVIPPDYANQAEFIRKFENEALRVARLEHPNIVPLYDYWREPDGAYLVMRWIQGVDLRTSLRMGRWKPGAINQLFEQITDALSSAHRQGIIHGDIRPENILLDDSGNAHLIDFGISPELFGLRPSTEMEGPDEHSRYKSPEQKRGVQINEKTDLYSLGMILFEMFAGEPPFAAESKYIEDGSTAAAILAQREDVPVAVDGVIQRATAENPDDRYGNVRELADDLRKALSIERRLPLAHVVSGPTELKNPFKGLRPFYEADAADFFGRVALTETLIERLKAGKGEDRFLALVGPSGSGKSSVIRAGLIPTLRQGAVEGSENWYVIQMLPGEHPLEELETALLRIAVNPPERLLHQMREDERGLSRAIKRSLPDDDSELLLFIDQFEEAFTLVEDEAERTHFLKSITAAVGEAHSRVRVVITLRADYYDRPLLYPEFGELLRTHMETLMPLSPTELERVISGPADRAGVNLEPGLISEIVADVSDEPGALPLLQYALTELFENREGDLLTARAYRSIGGVAGALGRSAEGEYIELDEHGKSAAKQLFLRLVTVGESAEETRRRVLQAEVNTLSEDVQEVTEVYGQARLLSFDRDPVTRGPTVEVAHEALLREWPRLTRWLEENRADLRLQRMLAIATGEWRESGNVSSFLLRGSRLDQFEGWAESTNITLTKDEDEFLEASLAKRMERRVAEETRRQKELEAVQKLARAEKKRAEEQAKSGSRLKRLASALGLFLIIALITSLFALQQSGRAAKERRLAASRELAAAAINNLETDPELSILLAIQAVSATYDQDGLVTQEAENALHQAILASRVRSSRSGGGDFGFTGSQRFDLFGSIMAIPQEGGEIEIWVGCCSKFLEISGHSGEIIGMSLDRTYGYIAVGGGDGVIRVWDNFILRSRLTEDDYLLDLSDSSPHTELYVLTAHDGGITNIAFSRDGSLLASSSRDGTAKVWDLEAGKEMYSFEGHSDIVQAVAFSPDGTQLATASDDHTAKIWDLISGEEITTLSGHTAQVLDMVFNFDGSRVATSSTDGTAKIWDLSTGEITNTFYGHSGSVDAVAIEPADAYIATGGEDATVRIWDIQTGEELLILVGHNAPIYHLYISPDGLGIETGSLDGSVKSWDIQPTGRQEWLTLVGHDAVVFDVAYNAEGNRLATASWDGTAILWSAVVGAKQFVLDKHTGEVTAVEFTPDGERLATSSFDGTAKVWDTSNGKEIISINVHSGKVFDVIFDLEGERLITAGEDGMVKVWNAVTGQELNSWLGHSRLINRLALSPGGDRLATAAADGTAKVWDSSSGEELLSLRGHSAEVLNVSFSPDGERLATAGGDGFAKVWDVETGEELLTLAGHSTSVWAAAFSPDGTRIATMSLDKTARLWDAETGEELLTLLDFNDGRDLAFNPVWDRLAVASGDGSLRIYILPIEDLMALARLRLTRSLTDEECRRYLHVADCPATR